MEERRGTISSQGSTQATSMRPTRAEAGGSFGSGTSSSIHSSHVWNYFSKEATEDPNRFQAFCLICIQNNRQQSPFLHAKGTGTGTLDQHLKTHQGITKQSHESGEAHEGLQQTQIGGFMTSSPGGRMPFSYSRDRMIEDFATYVTLDELPFSHGESPNLEHMIKHSLNPAFRRIPRNTLKRHTQK